MYYEDSQDSGPIDPPRPAHVPEKFWDAQTGAIRTDSLLQAYQDLERRMHRMVAVPGDDCSDEERCAFHRAIGVPETPDQYQVQERHPLLTSDPQVNQRLHQAGFTPRQLQLVYDLAHERVIPTIEGMASEYESQGHINRLRDHFGGEERWSETARQVAAWGRANLPPDVYGTLAASAEGIIAMRSMMNSGEPLMGRMPSPKDDAPSEADLKKMMQDQRYWKKRDPAFIEQVSAGFRRLNGD